ncbi:MAG: hypothetical protein M1821_007473 [Bathelium mastoideum]|nr:MAG: hypothetical protein M1821_007473 [Bathelium mastoideum]KAI9694976.1 MAG: hypothetical protein M1822_000593 [Bathelium mastoideum]
MNLIGSSTQPSQQRVEALNCPSLGGLSVQTEASIDNNYELAIGDERDDFFAPSTAPEGSNQHLDAWNPFPLEDNQSEYEQKSSYNGPSGLDGALYTDPLRSSGCWGDRSQALFAEDKSRDIAVVSPGVDQACELDLSCYAHPRSQGQRESSSGLVPSANGLASSNVTLQHSHCHTSNENNDLSACFPSLLPASGQVDTNLRQWPTSNFETATAPNVTEGAISAGDTLPFIKSETVLPQGSRIGTQTGLEDMPLRNDDQRSFGSEFWDSLHSATGISDPLYVNQHIGDGDRENTFAVPQIAGPYLLNSDPTQFYTITAPQLSPKDDFLIQQKRAGMTYKEIKLRGNFLEAESTLRGRYRNLTKRREERVRKPEWEEKDVALLKEAVQLLRPAPFATTRSRSSHKPKIPWKRVSEYIEAHGGSYRFGNATCRKKWDEIEDAEE